MLFKFAKVYNVDRFYADHSKDVKYAMRRPEDYPRRLKPSELLVHVNVHKPSASEEAAVAV